MVCHRHLRTVITLGCACSALFVSSLANASNITEVGEGGSEQMQRGGAWVARASEPIAAYYNPAGLAGQDTRLSVNTNVIFQHTCFSRVLAANDTTKEAAVDPNTALFPRVCNDISPFPNPQVAFNLRVTDRLGIALALLGPNAAGSTNWPEFVNGSQPSPQRYLLLKQSGTTVTPTLGFGYEVADGLRIGASFQWGIARFKLTNSTLALNSENPNPAANDVKALLQVKDVFFPGFTLGAIYAPSDEFEIAGWYKYSAPIHAKGDLVADSNYFTKPVSQGDTSGTKGTDTSYADCGYMPSPSNVCGSGKNADVRVVIPMEAKLGYRYHKLRARTRPPVEEKAGDGDQGAPHRRDPMSQDVFDVELDLTWTNNSALNTIQIRFPGDENGSGTIPVNGTAGGVIPPNADVKTGFKDVVGARLGGDYVLVPDALAVRAGVFAESSGQDQQYQNINFAGAARFGFGLGGTWRLHLAGDDKKSALEFSLGYGHIFFAVQDQGAQDRYAAGLPAIAGVACNPAGNNVVPTPQGMSNGVCSDGRPKYRTNWPVNLGTIWNSVNTINAGIAYRF